MENRGNGFELVIQILKKEQDEYSDKIRVIQSAIDDLSGRMQKPVALTERRKKGKKTTSGVCANTACGKNFKPNHKLQKYCSAQCRLERWRYRNKKDKQIKAPLRLQQLNPERFAREADKILKD